MLTAEQATRFGGQIMLKEIGGDGQRALQKARVLIVGIGGLGNPLAQALAGAGIGALGLVDDDRIERSNLNRQFLFTENDIGKHKARIAAKQLTHQFPDTKIETHLCRLDAENARALIAPYDIIADACDNFATRHCVADMCHRLKKPLISAAVNRFDAQLGNFQPYRQDASYPHYRCLVDAMAEDAEPCAQQGVLGAFTAMVGAMQALEVIREITGIGETLLGKLQIFDGLSGASRIIALPRDPTLP